MTDSDFIGYVQDPDVHDGVILRVQNDGDLVRVLVKAYDDRLHAFEFHGVRSLKSHKPEGVMLYSLSEMAAAPPLRRFTFAAWEGDGESFLEVTAEAINSYEVASADAFCSGGAV